MNKMHYDAAALGNHEFNYGIDTLRAYESQLDFPLLGANVVDPATKRPVFPPYVIKKYRIAPGRKLKVGILGLVTPGVAIWDKANVAGEDGVPRPGRAGRQVRPRAEGEGLRPGHRLGPLRRRHVLVVRGRAALPGERRIAGRRAGARHRRDPGRPRPQGDPAALRHQHQDRQAGAAVRALLLGDAAGGHEPDRRVAAAQEELEAGTLAQPAAQLQHRQGERQGLQGGARPARQGGRLRQRADRHVDRRAVGGPSRGRGRADHRLRAVRPGQGGQGRAHRRRRHAAGAVDRGAVQPDRVVPGRAGQRARRGRALHLRQHAAGGEGHRCPGQGLPGVLGALLQEDHRHRPVRDRRPDQRGRRRPRRTARRTTTSTPSRAWTRS